jgi:hypothetical protein
VPVAAPAPGSTAEFNRTEFNRTEFNHSRVGDAFSGRHG